MSRFEYDAEYRWIIENDGEGASQIVAREVLPELGEWVEAISRNADAGLRRAALMSIDRAEQEVHDLCSGKRRWTMTVPAEPDRDSDLLMIDAFDKARAILAAQESLNG